jgi:hypothetical protein
MQEIPSGGDMAKRQFDRDLTQADPLTPFWKVEKEILDEIKLYARRLGALRDDESFSEDDAKRLREKFSSGVFDWALRQMNGEVGRLLDAGKETYLDHFTLWIANPWRSGPKNKETFWEAFEHAEFFIPRRRIRRVVHHRDWPVLWRTYVDTVDRLNKLQKKKWRNPIAREMAYKENLPGIPDSALKKLIGLKKPSDRPLEYIRIKLKLPIGIEALKKYFRHFHKDPQYGYLDFVARELAQIKKN